jgi:hypothetical protein
MSVRTLPGQPNSERRLLEIERLAFQLLQHEIAANVRNKNPSMCREAQKLVDYFERYGIAWASSEDGRDTERVAFFDTMLGGLAYELDKDNSMKRSY